MQNKETKVPFCKALNVASMISKLALSAPFNITLYHGKGTVDGVDGDHIMVAPAYIVTRDEVDYIVRKLVWAVDTYFSRLASEVELAFENRMLY